MANVILLKGGQVETVFDLDDLLYLIDRDMGYDTRILLEELTAPEDDSEEYVAQLEKENQQLREHHREVMQALRAQSETIRRLTPCFVNHRDCFYDPYSIPDSLYSSAHERSANHRFRILCI